MKNKILLLNSNFEIIGFSKEFSEKFNSFTELIDFANNFKNEMFKNNGEAKINGMILKYNRYPIINNKKDIFYVTEIIEEIPIEKENSFHFEFDVDINNLKEEKFTFLMD